MAFKINRIKISNVRGIRRLDLPVDGRNFVVIGENGSGKSSLVDALEYYFTGRVEYLEGRADVSKSRCFSSLNGGSTEVVLTFKDLGPETGICMRYPNWKSCVQNSFRSIFSNLEKRPFVLRRYQLLGFINARDSGRYQRISQLIGLEDLDDIDLAWRKQQRIVEKQVKDLDRECRQALDRFKDILGQPVECAEALIRLLNIRLRSMGLPPIENLDELPERSEALRTFCQSSEVVSKADQLRTLRGKVEHFGCDLEKVLDTCDQFQMCLHSFWKQSDCLEDADFERLLQEGYLVLKSKTPHIKCPLCESPIDDYPTLIARLHSRLTNLKALTQARKQVTQTRNCLQSALHDLQKSLTEQVDLFTRQDLGKYLSLLTAVGSWVRSWQRLLAEDGCGKTPDEHWPDQHTVRTLLDALPQITRTIDLQLEVVSPTDRETEALNLLVTFTRVFEQWKNLQASELKLERARYVKKQIDLVYTTLIQSRIHGLKYLCEALEEDFRRLYTKLHPDEGYDAVTLEVQEDKRSSVGLRVVFHGQDAAHPLNYLSEGHLDSLGLCIFLAFIKRFNKDFKLIVLDDVWTAVDAGHRLRVARLLASEFSDYQLVITTYDQLWAKELKAILPRTKLFHLKPWRFELGACCQPSPPSDWEYYRQQVENGRPQDAIAGGGRNLEKFLYQMRNNLGLAIPARPNDNYTIGDLYGPFFKWLKFHSPISRPDWPGFDQDIQIIEQELGEVWRLRNWSGAHFNAWAAQVTSAEALSFLSVIENLVEAFACPVCHKLVTYNKIAGVLQCSYCQPAQVPKVVYQYQSEWFVRARRMLHEQSSQVRKHIAPMVQSAFARFLHDMQYRLLLSIELNKCNDYGVPQLYTPLFVWSAAHPRPEIPDWQKIIAASKHVLDTYWKDDQWLVVPESQLGTFVDGVYCLTQLFTCDKCSQLLDYDLEEEVYFCAQCSHQEVNSAKVPAYWFVTTDK